jgi:hypothetical protein
MIGCRLIWPQDSSVRITVCESKNFVFYSSDALICYRVRCTSAAPWFVILFTFRTRAEVLRFFKPKELPISTFQDGGVARAPMSSQICHQRSQVLLEATARVHSALRFTNCRIILRLLSDTLSLPETKFAFCWCDCPAWMVDLKTIVVNTHRLEHLLSSLNIFVGCFSVLVNLASQSSIL